MCLWNNNVFLFSWWERERDRFLLMQWEGERDLSLDRFERAEDSLTWRLLNLEAGESFPGEACLKETKLFGAFDCRCPVEFLHSETTRCPATISSVEIVRGWDPVTMPSEIEVLATAMSGAYTWLDPIPLSGWAILGTVEGGLVSGDTKLLFSRNSLAEIDYIVFVSGRDSLRMRPPEKNRVIMSWDSLTSVFEKITCWNRVLVSGRDS